MSSVERDAWIMGPVAIVAYATYVVIILSRAAGGPIAEVPYVWAAIWTIVGAVGANILLHILSSIVWPKDADRKDARDKQIARFGDHTSQGFVIAGALAAMLMAMAEWDFFWIANVIYLAFFLSAVLASVAKVVAYRKGFQPW